MLEDKIKQLEKERDFFKGIYETAEQEKNVLNKKLSSSAVAATRNLLNLSNHDPTARVLAAAAQPVTDVQPEKGVVI